ncbi:MAG: cytochrome c oxidase accessory protein CcoG [Neisseriaceae bacterium]|nr:cytochrome c oxidase accessory protein CcoG [Neisseriaceae bacterium]
MTKANEQEIELYQGSKRIHPKWTTGFFSKWRIAVVLITQFVFLILPWFNYDGRQAVLLHVADRHFYFFGLVLLPSDLIFMSGILFMAAFGLFWWTTIAGRLWCGYACPQTVYTEIMMWFDRLFEGDRAARLKLEKAPWDARKIRIKTMKYIAIFLMCAWIGLSFVGWFTPIREVFKFNMTGTQWGVAIFYGFITFLLAHIMREQVCRYMCPYARFQSAMFDKDTLIISYDSERGEPRGKKKKGDDASGKGDCIDCTLCVQVCPVGIDIRNGLQYECIGCAACIDACDEVMEKVKKPKGLIRYTTEAALEKVYPENKIWTRLKRPRVVGYGLILLVILAAWIVGIMNRQNVRVDVIKDRGVMVRYNEQGRVENTYTLRFLNASDKAQVVNAEISGIDGIQLTGVPQNYELNPGDPVSMPAQVSIPAELANADDGKSTKHIFFKFTYKAKDGGEERTFEEKASFVKEIR